jgi:hypothetical protein
MNWKASFNIKDQKTGEILDSYISEPFENLSGLFPHIEWQARVAVTNLKAAKRAEKMAIIVVITEGYANKTGES